MSLRASDVASPRQKGLLAVFLWGVGVLGASGGVGLGLNIWLSVMESHDRRAVPWVYSVPVWLLLVAYLAVAVGHSWRLWRSGAEKQGGAEGRRRWRQVLLVHAGWVMVGVSLAVGAVVSSPDFPFSPALLERADSPSGQRRAYLFREFMCVYAVYEGERGGLSLEVRERVSRNSCDEPVRLRWIEPAEGEHRAIVVDASGKPLESQPWNLYLGPH